MKRSLLVNVILISLCLLSCKNDLITQPTPEPDVTLNPSDYADEIAAPENLTATQGSFKEIILTWTSLPNAVQYQVFSAETPFDTFLQVAETSDNSNTISITEKPGVSKYYKIKAVNYFGTVSDASNTVLGSTLATPFITSVESFENGNGSKVVWWMENCSSVTYQNNVHFIITCFNSDQKTVFSTKNASGSERSVTFENQEPHTNYYYMVEAFLASAQESIEKSELIDAETARKLVPKAAKDFTAEKGTSSKSVILSWTLPDFTDYSLENNAFEQHPVYFTIERKPYNASDSAYSKIVSYLGTVTQDDNKSTDTTICFNSESSESSSENLSVDNKDQMPVNTLYRAYIPGTKLTYQETNVTEGSKYTYRIRSYTDDCSKTISSDESVSTCDGWLISSLSFSTKSSYKYDVNDPTKITETTVSFTAAFENLSTEYTYVLAEEITPFSTAENPSPSPEPRTLIACFPSIEAVNNYTKIIDCTSSSQKKGKYKYTLYITKKGSASFTDSYLSTESLRQIIVADTTEALPKTLWFDVKDGYKDKFILSWDYHEGLTYSIKWTPSSGNSATIPLTSKDFTLSQDNTVATYIYNSQSGVTGNFELEGKPEIGDTEKIAPENDSYSTLGTPELTISKNEYDKLIVEWSEIPKARLSPSDYDISAHYQDSPSNELCNAENTIIEKVNDKYICTISKPNGYNNPSVSGKPVQISVTAKSISTEDTTTAIETGRTLGPAELKTTINDNSASQIIVTWNEIPGISNYVVYRTKYKYEDISKIERTDTIFIHKENNTVSLQINKEDFSDTTLLEITFSDNSFTLKDKYKEAGESETDAFKINQSQISWGIPFGYVILPVKEQDDFIFNPNSLNLSSSSKVDYTTERPLQDTKGATYGYGLMLKAEKAVDGKNQKITWTKPYNTKGSPTLYRRECFVDNAKWTTVNTTVSKNDENCSYTVDTQINDEGIADIDRAFEYIISYNTNVDIAPSFIKNLEKYQEKLVENHPAEQLNKGYLLAVSFTAKPGNNSDDTEASDSYFREMLEWNLWDYNKKSVGPSSAVISLNNKNFSDGWKQIYSLTDECRPYAALCDEKLNLNLSPEAKKLFVSPVMNQDKLTDGYLKVLRDTKHYYKLELTRDKTTVAFEKSTYRQISNAELCRCVSLIIADALVQCGIDGGGERNCGKFYIKHTGGTKTVTWGTGNNKYTHKFTGGLNKNNKTEYESEFTIQIQNVDSRAAVDGNQLYHLPNATVNVTHPFYAPNSPVSLTITVGEEGKNGITVLSDGIKLSFDCTWTVNGQTIKTISNNKTEFLKWFPYLLGTKYKDGITTENTSLPEYQSPWWN